MHRFSFQPKFLAPLGILLVLQNLANADCGAFYGQQFKSFSYPNYISSQGGNLLQIYTPKQVVYQKAIPVQVVHPVYYAVAYNYQVQSLQQQQIRSDPEYQRWLQFKAFEAGQLAAQEQINSKPPSSPVQPSTQALRTHCASCHGQSLTTPKGGVYIDSGIPLSGDLVGESLRLVNLPADHPDKMPKAPNTLQPQDYPAIMADLLSGFELYRNGESNAMPSERPNEVVPPPLRSPNQSDLESPQQPLPLRTQ